LDKLKEEKMVTNLKTARKALQTLEQAIDELDNASFEVLSAESGVVVHRRLLAEFANLGRENDGVNPWQIPKGEALLQAIRVIEELYDEKIPSRVSNKARENLYQTPWNSFIEITEKFQMPENEWVLGYCPEAFSDDYATFKVRKVGDVYQYIGCDNYGLTKQIKEINVEDWNITHFSYIPKLPTKPETDVKED
jgi:hypothetical protein